MVSTRNAKKAKTEADAGVSIAGGGGDVGLPITLPESIYWNHVRPFTPVKDRAVVSKRCSTRYYAGKRVNIDETYLKEYERRIKVKNGRWVDGDTGVYENLPITRGEPGKNLRIYFRSSYFTNSDSQDHSTTDPDVALEMLRHAREAWDLHLSKIPSPSGRLHACLEMLHTDEHDGTCPLLFVGKGEISDVIKFHASVNLASLNGPWHERNLFPKTQLGYWVECYLREYMNGVYEERGYCSIWRPQVIVSELLDAGADVSPFFKPLEVNPRTFSVLGGDRDFYERGLSMHQVLTRHADWIRQKEDAPWDYLGGQAGHTIGHLLDSLGRKSNTKLRFNAGDKVLCFMGEEDGWTSGTIKKQWYYGYPYELYLDGSTGWAPFDGDECIRAWDE